MTKLINLLQSNKINLNNENDVNRIMSEIRKVLEATQKKREYPILNFYCDWMLHPQKDRITPEMTEIISKIYVEISKDIEIGFGFGGTNISAFTYMENLKTEIQKFLAENDIKDHMTKTRENWIAFINALTKILVEQPINNPIPEITKIEFCNANENCAIWKAFFKDKIKDRKGIEYSFYVSMNAY